VPLRSSNKLVYIAIDDLISTSGKPLTGFPEFLQGLEEANLPCVWISSRNRHELDSAIRKLGHAAPFIAEGGSGVYLPEDYFHLKPAKTIRFARFTVIPVATPQPAAAEALDQLAEDTGIEAVALRTLSPRELSQNVGLAQREAELLRQRDFDELFFFAGASDAEIKKFQAEAARRNLQLRPRGNLWSLVAGANLATCIRQLTGLYERAIRAHPFSIALATAEDASELFPCCNRGILLAARSADSSEAVSSARTLQLLLPLFAPDTWEAALESILAKRV
jgi:predicted mannosyl-3-phosphoglycerate phosphatase (HAD superfamily)